MLSLRNHTEHTTYIFYYNQWTIWMVAVLSVPTVFYRISFLQVPQKFHFNLLLRISQVMLLLLM